VLRFLFREAAERTDGQVITEHLCLRVLHRHREDVLLDELEDVEVRVPRDLVELAPLARV
jgi:hypothetical protein